MSKVVKGLVIAAAEAAAIYFTGGWALGEIAMTTATYDAAINIVNALATSVLLSGPSAELGPRPS
jgi:hypothetical protein